MTPTAHRGRSSLPRIRVGSGTLLLIPVLMVLVMPSLTRVLSGPAALVAAAIIALLMLASVAAHEIAHALAARAAGGHVHEIALTFMGGHTRYTSAGIGPWASTGISLVGPLTNVLLALGFGTFGGVAGSLLVAAGVPVEWGRGLVLIAAMSATLNWALAIFNLLPGLPMDGGRALESILVGLGAPAARATLITGWIGRGVAALVVLVPAWRALSSGQLPSLLILVLGLVIAGMLWQGASEAMRHARLLERAEALSLSALARPVRAFHESMRLGSEATHLAQGGLYVRSDGSLLLPDPTLRARASESAMTELPLSSALMVGPVPAPLPISLTGSALLGAMAARPADAYLLHGPAGEVIGAVLGTDVQAALSPSR